MFQQLPESNAVVRPRFGGSVVSVVGHATAIAVLVVLTATTPTATPETIERSIYFTPPAPPSVQPVSTLAPTASSSAAASCLPACASAVSLVRLEIPIGIPAIDFTRPAMGGEPTFGHSALRGVGDGIPAGTFVDTGESWSAEQVDRPVLLRPGAPAPLFPEALRSAGVSGSVLAEFVVDTLGRIEPASVQMLSIDHDQFGAAVRAVLPKLRFLPAERQGRKVRQLVRLPFRFDLHEGEGNSNLGLI